MNSEYYGVQIQILYAYIKMLFLFLLFDLMLLLLLLAMMLLVAGIGGGSTTTDVALTIISTLNNTQSFHAINKTANRKY